MARPKRYGSPINLRLTEVQEAAVQAEADRLDMAKADVVRQLINKELLGVSAR